MSEPLAMVITSDDVSDDIIYCQVCGQEITGVGLKVRFNDKIVYIHKECMFKIGK